MIRCTFKTGIVPFAVDEVVYILARMLDAHADSEALCLHFNAVVINFR